MKGFTLIELLVVITVLAILIAIAVPAGKRFFVMSDEVACKTNMRTLAAAFIAYEADNGVYPQSREFVRANPWPSWAQIESVRKGTIWPYVGSEKAYLCPTFERAYKLNPSEAHQTPACGYVMNEYFNFPCGWQGMGSGWPADPARLLPNGSGCGGADVFHGLRAEVQFPASEAILGEENTWKIPGHSNWIINNNALGIGRYNDNSIVDGMATFHQPTAKNSAGQFTAGHSHVAFVDGHVELLPHTDTKKVFTPVLVKRHVTGDPNIR